MAKIGERVEAFLPDQVNAAAIAAITAIRPAAWNEFFAPKRQRAVAAGTGFDSDGSFINEFHKLTPAAKPRRTQRKKSLITYQWNQKYFLPFFFASFATLRQIILHK
jgi:hypothetical protein